MAGEGAGDDPQPEPPVQCGEGQYPDPLPPRRGRYECPRGREHPDVHGPEAPRERHGHGPREGPGPPHPGIRQAPEMAEHHLRLVRQIPEG